MRALATSSIVRSFALVILIGVVSSGGTAPASAATVGKSIDAELYEVNGPSGTFIHVQTQFTSPALIGPGSEFSGVLQFGRFCSSCISGIEIDFDDTGFTVFSTIGNIIHNGSQFGIKIFNLPDNIIDVLEFAGSGFEAELNIEPGFVIDLRYSGWSNGSVDRYGFVFSTPPLVPIPEPTTLALFATGLAGLGFMMRRRRKLDVR